MDGVTPGVAGFAAKIAKIYPAISKAEGGEPPPPNSGTFCNDCYAAEADERSSMTSDVGLMPISDSVRLATASAAASK
jgi:hypothetical protein